MSLRCTLLTGTSLAAFSLAFGTTGFAQSTTDLVALDEIVVTGSGDTTAPVAGYVANDSSTATKTATPILEVPQSVSVITGDQIEDQGATTLGDTLGYSAGILAEPYGTDPRFDAPVIRGFDGANAQFLNGLRILRAQGAPSFEIYSTERIEILKGPASVLYGSGIPGGVINQVQKRAYNADFAEAGVGVGSPKSNEVFLDWNKALSDDVSARVTAVARDSEGNVDEIKNTRGYLGLATRWTPQDGTEIQFLGSYQGDRPVSPVGVPYNLLGQVDDDRLRSFYFGDTGADDSDRTTANIGFEVKQDLGAGWQLQGGFRYQDLDWDYEAPYTSNTVADGDTITRGISYNGEHSQTADLDLRATNTFTFGQVTHSVLVGAEQRRFDSSISTEFAYMDSLSLSNPIYDGGNPTAPWYTSQTDLVLKQSSLYGQDEITWGNWHGSLALRHDWISQSGTQVTNYGNSDLGIDAEATTGRVGLSYLFDNGMAPYASYATSFDVPSTGADIDGNALEPTKGKQWELGVKYQPAGFDGLFSVAAFDLTQSNVSSSVVENGISGTRQIGEVRSKGIEIEATANLAHNWNLRGSYTWNETEQTKGDNIGNELGNAPEHSANLWLTHEFTQGQLEGLSLGGGIRYIGARYNDAANTYKLDDVTLLDLSAGYDLSADTSLALNVSNVTDKAYVASCSAYYGCYYGDGRTVQLRLTHKW
ncbi:TonB-dependent siderophore receptor [Thioclava kandeliae]|uniref:TonB-dependent siderophore receptor n=1 Tax=Thioclava kandeliae TaxID=3070818 RepID=A0ABV1SE90_9RHOB